MNEQITIHVEAKMIVVNDGRMKNARLWFQAPGLDIYVLGAVRPNRIGAILGLAIESALSRHIPLIALKDVQERPVKKHQPVNPNARRLF